MHIALINHSTHFAKKLPAVRLIAHAISTQLSKHVAPAWESTSWACVYYADENAAPPSAYRLFLFDNADQAGALGYHDQDQHGMPYGRVFVETVLSNGGTELSGPNSVSVTASHEAVEIFGDRQAGTWDQMPDGRLTAHELCDAVEGDSYEISVTGVRVSVSNFLLPEWFDTNPEIAKFDYLGKLGTPFTMTPGGYLIVMKGGKVSQVFGESFAPFGFRAAMKAMPGGRTKRRLQTVA